MQSYHQDERYIDAMGKYLSGQWAEADAAFQGLDEAIAGEAFIKLLRGNIAYSRGELEDAVARYREAIEARPDFGNAYYKLGVCLYRMGRLKQALEAFQSLSMNPVITMRMLEGELTIDDDERAMIRAPQARFDSETQIMAFEEGGVELRLSSGGEAFLGVSEVDLENGTLSSQEPVRIANDEVTLDAGGMQGFDGGERLLFTDGVRMVFTPARDGT